MKAYTDLEQSKKLAEILPLESADMHYCLEQRGVATEYEIGVTNFNYAKRFKGKCNIADVQPAWSLAALLEIIKKLVGYSLQSLDTHTVFMNCELGDKPYNIETENYDNPVDACYEMIIRLNELKVL